MSALNQSLLTVVEIMLIVTLPLVALAAIQNMRLASERLKTEVEDRKRKSVGEIVKTAVAAAEQTGLLDNLVGAEKKEMALEVAESFLRERGLNVDLRQLSNLIEAEVLNLTHMESATSTPSSAVEQQELVNNAVETAVLAAEQSGTKGFIPNVGTDKKAYALKLAAQFLEANGIHVDEELLGGLIEGQVMKLVLAARGQLPSTR